MAIMMMMVVVVVVVVAAVALVVTSVVVVVVIVVVGWHGGITVRASDLRSVGRGFDSRSDCIKLPRSTQPG